MQELSLNHIMKGSCRQITSSNNNKDRRKLYVIIEGFIEKKGEKLNE